jgi:hypothetical protein
MRRSRRGHRRARTGPWTADGQIAYRLKRPWPDGRTELVLPPVTFLRPLVVDSALARAVLAALGLPCTPTTFAPARDPPQGELWFDDAS